MTALHRLSLALGLAVTLTAGCMESSPVPDWVYRCHDAQGGPDCAPVDATTTPRGSNAVGPRP